MQGDFYTMITFQAAFKYRFFVDLYHGFQVAFETGSLKVI